MTCGARLSRSRISGTKNCIRPLRSVIVACRRSRAIALASTADFNVILGLSALGHERKSHLRLESVGSKS